MFEKLKIGETSRSGPTPELFVRVDSGVDPLQRFLSLRLEAYRANERATLHIENMRTIYNR